MKQQKQDRILDEESEYSNINLKKKNRKNKGKDKKTKKSSKEVYT